MIEHGSQISFEFFPPADAKMDAALWRAVETLAPFAPSFVSVTYGADGSTRDRTRSLVQRIARDSRLIAVPHLTCVGATREETLEIAQRYWQDGVRHIVALRGDAPQGSDGYRAHPGGFAYARDLVEGLRSVAPFEISVAAYPQTHPEALSAEADLDNLRAKFEAGASRAITQFFFETDDFLRFRDRCAAAGITGPVSRRWRGLPRAVVPRVRSVWHSGSPGLSRIRRRTPRSPSTSRSSRSRACAAMACATSISIPSTAPNSLPRSARPCSCGRPLERGLRAAQAR
jgi:hypothetical protein